MIATSIISFVVCHGGPAAHFAAFREALAKKGHQIEIYASGPAADQLKKSNTPFIPFDSNSSTAAKDVAARVKNSSVVLTDVGYFFDETLQRELQGTHHAAYYDNGEPFVTAEWSSQAARVMNLADSVLFANANLAESEILDGDKKPIDFGEKTRFGIGYYPIAQAEALRERRHAEHPTMRAKLFEQLNIEDCGQRLITYFGGNNSTYFDEALPAFLKMVEQGALSKDALLILQQHPGAKAMNRDGTLAQGKLHLSPLSSEEAMVATDVALYYQTSMGPQFVIAEIPTIQVGHEIYSDILVRSGLAPSATDATTLKDALKKTPPSLNKEQLLNLIGIRADWEDRLERALFSQK